MKKEYTLLFVFALLACSRHGDDSMNISGHRNFADPSDLTGTTNKPESLEPASQTFREKDFIECIVPLALPDGFKVDSTYTIDKQHNTYLILHFPMSRNNKLDNLVRKKIQVSSCNYLNYIEDGAKEDADLLTYPGNHYHYKLLSLTENGSILSYLFLEQGYVNGMMNHSNYKYHSINFNRSTNKEIDFNEVLAINTSQDTAAFLTLITKTLNYPNAELFAVGPPEFILNGDKIIFCFSPYEVSAFAFGMFQANVPKSRLSEWLKPEYR